MDIRKLEVFCRVVDLKSFTGAAESVLLSQPTVSEHIRNLENELGHKLINRLGKEIEATPVGRILYEYGSNIIRTQQEAVQAFEQYSGTLRGKIKIGCGTIPGTYILPELISRFHDEHPTLNTLLRITSSKTIAMEVLSGELELGFVGARWKETRLDWTEMFSDELTLALHPDHPLAELTEVRLEDVIDMPFILREPESGTRKVFSGLLAQAGLKESDLHIVAEIESTAAVKEAVKAGIGLSVLSKRAARDDVQCGRLVTVGIQGLDLNRPFYFIKRKNRDLSPVAKAFWDYLRKM